MNDLGRWVRFRRERVLKISQEELARRSGLSWSTIQEIENPNNERRRSRRTLERLAVGLGVSIERIQRAIGGDVSEDAPVDGAFFHDVERIPGMIPAIVLDDGRHDPLVGPPKVFHVPEVVSVGRPLFASFVRDDSMAPRFITGDVVVWYDEPDPPDGKSCWLVFVDGRQLLREVSLRGENVGLVSSNPVQLNVVLRKDISRIGRVIYLARSV